MHIPDFMIAENIPEPIIVLGHSDDMSVPQNEPVILWVNAAAELWLRRSCNSLSGKVLNNISPDFSVVSEKLTDALVKQSSIRGRELPIRLAQDRKFLCNYLMFPCQNSVGLLIKPQEIGLRLNTDGSREGAVTMLGKMLAHELKNPLAGIRGAAQLLEGELTTGDDLELTALITTEVDRIGRLVEQIEKFGADENAIYESFNIHTILRNAKLLFQSQNKLDDFPVIHLVENYDPSLPYVYGDKDALMQVIINLIGNAMEAIRLDESQNPRSGIIEIKTLYRAGINRHLENGVTQSLPVEIQIIDNGPGVSEKIRDKVFHPFVTGKANGHGLGLALVSTIVERHGGLVDLISKPGKTTFSLLLPIKQRSSGSTNVRSQE